MLGLGSSVWSASQEQRQFKEAKFWNQRKPLSRCQCLHFCHVTVAQFVGHHHNLLKYTSFFFLFCFSYTFQTVQDNSTKVWRYYRLSLVSEYFDRPSFVPPIIIINHIFRLLRWIVYKKTKKGKRPNAFREYIVPEWGGVEGWGEG